MDDFIGKDYTKKPVTAPAQPKREDWSGDYTKNYQQSASPSSQQTGMQASQTRAKSAQSQTRASRANPQAVQPKKTLRKNAVPQPAAGGRGGNGNNGANTKKGAGKQPPKKKKNSFLRMRRPGIWSGLLTLAVFAAFAFAVYELVKIDLFPFYLIVAAAVVALTLTLLIVILWWAKARRPIFRTLCFVLVGALTLAYAVGGTYLIKTGEVFTNVTNLTDKMVNTVSLITLQDSSYDTVSSLKGAVIGTVVSVDPEGTEQAEASLGEQINYTIQNYESVFDQIDALYNGQVDAILFPENSRGIVHDIEAYFSFNTVTNILDQTVYYTERTANEINEADAVANITKDPFTILISGNDSYGGLNTNSRSDVNMLVTINPKTNVVLITSVPRDSYVQLTCKKDETACDSYYEDGSPVNDKLTHSGLNGIGATESTIEDFMGIEINYTVRVNFSSLVNLVDALGGIDVYVEEGLAVERFYANGEEGVEEGWNHLNGERALAFARERYAYTNGDNQRIKNQQIVMQALINQVISPEIFIRYPALMDAVGIAFETNMPASQIKDFIRYEVMNLPAWNIISYAVAGESDVQLCYWVGSYASVTIPYESMLQTAKDAIDAVLSGDSAETVQAVCDSNALPSGQSKSLEEQRSQFEVETDTYSYDESYSGYDDSYTEYESSDIDYYSDDSYYGIQEYSDAEESENSYY